MRSRVNTEPRFLSHHCSDGCRRIQDLGHPGPGQAFSLWILLLGPEAHDTLVDLESILAGCRNEP